MDIDLDEEIDRSKWSGQSRRGAMQTKYALFYHPLLAPNNTWVWKFFPGVLVGFFGSLILFGNRLRRKRVNGLEDDGSRTSLAPLGDSPGDVKLMLVVNGELKSMKPGKMGQSGSTWLELWMSVGAQCGHAAGMVMKKLMLHHRSLLNRWEQCGTKKICVKGNSTSHLEYLSEHAKRERILVTPVFDAGKTQVEEGSLTVVAIGPADASMLHPITGELKLMT